MRLTRRSFLGLLTAALLLPSTRLLGIGRSRQFRVRTVTAGAPLLDPADLSPVRDAISFLGRARSDLAQRGHEVQTVRIATQPLAEYLPDWKSEAAIRVVEGLDRIAREANLVLSVGPVLDAEDYDPDFGPWAAEILRRTSQISLSVTVASEEGGVHRGNVQAAAEAIVAIARGTPSGIGNFRFAAAAMVPPGTPFFPVARFARERTFSVGLESPNLLLEAIEAAGREATIQALRSHLEAEMAPVDLAAREGWQYLGLDVSPAPGLDASIGAVIEAWSGVPFGEPSTLDACAALTEVLQGLDLQTCGYSGLMLPVLEDPILAQRAAEGRYGIPDLLLYSSVCGTGLDVVPIAGSVSAADLERLIGDVAALARRYRKPLSARLFPVPGKEPGDAVVFDDPYLTDGVVMPLR
jgi:uncharacterized protein (UPF0210 family)